jgi:hypothetical protein
MKLTQINEPVKHLACGACSAVVSRTVVAPLERIKMEVILNHEHNNSWRQAVQHIWSRGGEFNTRARRGLSGALLARLSFAQCRSLAWRPQSYAFIPW